jgi:hypothetical protein
MLRSTTEPIKLQGAPALSRAGSISWFVAWPWTIVGLGIGYAGLDALHIVDRDAPLLLRVAGFVLILVFAFTPLAVIYFPRRPARLRPFRWLLAATQPGATLDREGLELCTPEDGCRRFRWDEIARLEPDPAWLRGSFVEGYPTVDLTSLDGRVLFRVPGTVYGYLDPIGSRWRSGPRTLAEHVVVMRPDRYSFIDPLDAPPHFWFRLSDTPTREPATRPS